MPARWRLCAVLCAFALLCRADPRNVGLCPRFRRDGNELSQAHLGHRRQIDKL